MFRVTAQQQRQPSSVQDWALDGLDHLADARIAFSAAITAAVNELCVAVECYRPVGESERARAIAWCKDAYVDLAYPAIERLEDQADGR